MDQGRAGMDPLSAFITVSVVRFQSKMTGASFTGATENTNNELGGK
jgi:hypothetical protein